MSLLTKFIRGASTNVLEHGLKVVVMFVTTPLMVSYLGKENYGTWLLAIAIIAYFRLLDLGVSFAGSRFLGTALGAGDREGYRTLVCKLFRLFTLVGSAALVLTVVLIWMMPLFIQDAGMLATVRILVAGFGVATAMRFYTRIFEVILKSHVRYDLIGISSIVKTILQAGLVIGLLLADYGLIALLVAHILVDVFDQLLLVIFARRVETDLRLRGRSGGVVGTGQLLRYSATAMVTSAGQSLRQGIDPLIITHVSGVATLPSYSVGARFLGVFSDVINAIFGGNLISAFSQLHGRGDPEALKERFLQAIRFSTMLAMIGGSMLIMFGPDFVLRWVGPDFAESGTILLILTPVFTLSLCQYPVWSLFYSQNKHHWLAIFTIVSGVFNLALSLYLAWRIGWIGVVWATSVEMTLAFGLVTPWLVSRVCDVPFLRYARQILTPGTGIAVASAGFWFFTHSLVQPAYDRLFLLGFGYVAGISIFIWLLVLTESERSRLRTLLKPKRTQP